MPDGADLREAYLERLADQLPLPPDEREPLRAALVMLCSWSAWDSWRTHQRLSVARSRAALQAGLRALLRES